MALASPDIPSLRDVIASPLPFLFVLSVVVFIHELGHFLVARWCGVKVVTFALGFGREIWGFNDKHGTRWKVCWLPLGGYVSFPDDANPASKPSPEALARMSPEELAGAFHTKKLWQKAAVIAAGPIANFLLAIVVLAGIYMAYGKGITSPRVYEVIVGGAAEQAGFKAGDLIVSIDGEAVESFGDIQRVVNSAPSSELVFGVERDAKIVTLKVTPVLREIDDGFGSKVKVGQIGIRGVSTPDQVKTKQFGVFAATREAVRDSYFIGSQTLAYLRDVILQRRPPDQLGGPGRIADTAKKVADLGFIPLLSLIALISVSIGLLNLLPIPPLDGGHLLFYGIEALRGKPSSARAQELGFGVGLSAILVLFVYANWNDRGIFLNWFTQLGRVFGLVS